MWVSEGRVKRTDCSLPGEAVRLPIQAVPKELTRRLTGEISEGFDEMCLIVIAGCECGFCETAGSGVCADGIPKTDNGRKVFRGCTHCLPEPFFESILADV